MLNFKTQASEAYTEHWQMKSVTERRVKLHKPFKNLQVTEFKYNVTTDRSYKVKLIAEQTYNYGERTCTFNHFLPMKMFRLNKNPSLCWRNCFISIDAIKEKLNLWVVVSKKSAKACLKLYHWRQSAFQIFIDNLIFL